MTSIHHRQPSAWPDCRQLAGDRDALDLGTAEGRENIAEAIRQALASGQAVLPKQGPNYKITPKTSHPPHTPP